MKIGIIVLTYNMPEEAKLWHEYAVLGSDIERSLYVIENGTEMKRLLNYGKSYFVSQNVRTTGGVLYGLNVAYQDGCTHVWVISTSTLPPVHPWNYDPVAKLAENMREDVVCVAPTFIGESKSWPHQLLMSNGTDEVEQHWLVGLFAFWEIEFLMRYVDPRLSWSWGVDFDISFRARSQGLTMLKHNGVTVRLREGIGYKKDRMGCTVLEREKYAREEMETILTQKYGEYWKNVIIPFEQWKYIEQM